MKTLPLEVYPEVRSERILLRRIVAADIERNMEIITFNRMMARNREEALEMIEKVHQRYLSGESVHWGIEDLSSGELVGCCGFYRGFPNETGEVGYKLKEAYRKQGWMTEAVRVAVSFGFKELELKKIIAVTGQDNLASQNVLRRNGFIAAEIREGGDLVFHKLR
jgi:ribosomal-protein-alanine N-acetyltransferase